MEQFHCLFKCLFVPNLAHNINIVAVNQIESLHGVLINVICGQTCSKIVKVDSHCRLELLLQFEFLFVFPENTEGFGEPVHNFSIGMKQGLLDLFNLLFGDRNFILE